MHIRSYGLHAYAKRVFRLVVSERSPGRGVLGENNRPFIGVWDHVQSVRSLVERFSFDHDRVAERDRCVFIYARAPDFAVWNQSIPDLAIFRQRTVILDRYIGNPNSL